MIFSVKTATGLASLTVQNKICAVNIREDIFLPLNTCPITMGAKAPCYAEKIKSLQFSLKAHV